MGSIPTPGTANNQVLDRTWAYLTTDAGAGTTAVRDPGGHGLSTDALTELRGWLTTTIADVGAPS